MGRFSWEQKCSISWNVWSSAADRPGKSMGLLFLNPVTGQLPSTINEVIYAPYKGLADTKYRPCPLLVKYVEAGWIGKKAGRSFYDYSGDEPIPTR